MPARAKSRVCAFSTERSDSMKATAMSSAPQQRSSFSCPGTFFYRIAQHVQESVLLAPLSMASPACSLKSALPCRCDQQRTSVRNQLDSIIKPEISTTRKEYEYVWVQAACTRMSAKRPRHFGRSPKLSRRSCCSLLGGPRSS